MEAPAAGGALAGAVAARSFAAALKLLQAQGAAEGPAAVQALLNQAFCFEQLGLTRKAVKVPGSSAT